LGACLALMEGPWSYSLQRATRWLVQCLLRSTSLRAQHKKQPHPLRITPPLHTPNPSPPPHRKPSPNPLLAPPPKPLFTPPANPSSPPSRPKPRGARHHPFTPHLDLPQEPAPAQRPVAGELRPREHPPGVVPQVLLGGHLPLAFGAVGVPVAAGGVDDGLGAVLGVGVG